MVYQISKNNEIVSVLKGYSGYTSFNTWEDAYKFLLDKVNERIKDAEDAFKKACKDRVLIEKMKP